MLDDLKYPKFISEFSDYLIAIKNFSDVYVKNIIVTLKQFIAFINVHKLNNKYDSIEKISVNEIRSLTNSDIYSFIYFLAENHYKQGSRTLKVEHLRTFFDFLYRIKHNIFKEPFKQIKREKNNSLKLPNYLSLNESRRLLELYANSEKNNEIRDNAILHLFLNCGLRISEVSNINIPDINLDNNTILILGKGKKERIAYLNSNTKAALEKYLEIRKKEITKYKKDKDKLFIGRTHTKLCVRAIQKIIKKAYELAEINAEEYSAHTLRHTCATLLYKNGVDIKTIKELLGHVRIDTTEIYTHLHDEKVMNAMRIHPLSKFKMEDALAFCA